MKTTRTKQFLFLVLLGCMAAPAEAQTVDVTLQCGQSYTINSTAAAGTDTPTYRWLENGSTITGAVANYTVTNKSVGIYTYIRQAKSAGCTDWQNSNAFTVEVKNKEGIDGVCIGGVMWAKYNVDEPGSFTTSIDNPGKLYQFNRTKAWDRQPDQYSLPPISDLEWSPDSSVCPIGWRLPTPQELQNLISEVMLQPDGTLGVWTLSGDVVILWIGKSTAPPFDPSTNLPIPVDGYVWLSGTFLPDETQLYANPARSAGHTWVVRIQKPPKYTMGLISFDEPRLCSVRCVQ
jgi:hypothetical protein